MFLKLNLEKLLSPYRPIVVAMFEPSQQSKKQFGLPEGYKWIVYGRKNKKGQITLYCNCLGYVSSKRRWGKKLGACKHIQAVVKNYFPDIYEEWLKTRKKLKYHFIKQF
jgi:predicted nucleic acid-binding Zn finger protein